MRGEGGMDVGPRLCSSSESRILVTFKKHGTRNILHWWGREEDMAGSVCNDSIAS